MAATAALLPRIDRALGKPAATAADLDRAHPLARGLLDAFVLAEGAGPARDLARPKLATLAGATWIAGPSGPRLAFGGAAQVNTGIADALGDFTCAVWFRATPGANGPAARLVDKNYAAGFWMGRSPSAAGSWGAGIAQSTSPFGLFIALADGQDHQLVVTRQGSTQWVYGDGGAVAATQACSAATTDATALVLGFGGGNHFTGAVDRLLLYGRALTAGEVARLWAEPFAMLRRPRRVWAFTSGIDHPQSLATAQAISASLTTKVGQGVLLSAAQATTAAVGRGVGKLLAAAQGSVARATMPTPIWPTLPAFSAANFLDHFAGASLDATRWTAVTSGGGTAAVADSCLHLTAPAGGAAFAYYNAGKLDTTKSQLWWVCGSCDQQSGRGSNFLSLVNSASAPTPDTKANLDAIRRLECGMGTQQSAPCLMALYDPAGANQFWHNDTSQWAAYANVRWSPAQLNDFYIWALEFDGPNLRWRVHIYGQAFITPGTWTFDQGWREFGVSDWVNWSGQGASDNLWLVLGHQHTDATGTDEYRIEWVRYAEGPRVEAWAGAKDSAAAGHQIRHYYSYDGLAFVPDDRTSWSVALGASSPDNVEVHSPCVVWDGAGTDAMFYVAKDSSGATTFGVATAPHAIPQVGPWTKQGTQLGQGASGADDDAQINSPFVMCDLAESDSNKRWKCLYNGKKAADSKWRTLYATAPAATGPWTKQGTVLDVGGAGALDETWARSMAVVREAGAWTLWYEGHDAAGVDHALRATGPDWATWTKDGAGSYRDAATGQDQPLTADLSTAPGRTITVSDTSSLQPDGMILLSQSTGVGTWSSTRIRKILSSTQIETYHGLTGFSASYPTRLIQLSGSKTWNYRCVVRVGDQRWIYCVVWEPFSASGDGANYSNVFEQCFLLIVDAPTSNGAPPIYQLLPDPVIPRGYNSDSGSVENMSLFGQPFAGDGGGGAFTQLLTATQAVAGSLLRGVGKAFGATQPAASTLSRGVGKPLTMTQPTAPTLATIKSKLLSLAAAQATTATIGKGVGLARAIAQATVAMLGKGVTKPLAASQGNVTTLATLKSKLLTLSVAQATAATLGKGATLTRALAQGTQPALTKAVALPLSIAQSTITILGAAKQSGGTTITLAVIQPTQAGLSKAAALVRTAQQATVPTLGKATGKSLAAAQASLATLAALPVKLVALVVQQPTAASLGRGVGKALAVSQGSLATAGKAVGKGIAASAGTIASLIAQGSGAGLSSVQIVYARAMAWVLKVRALVFGAPPPYALSPTPIAQNHYATLTRTADFTATMPAGITTIDSAVGYLVRTDTGADVTAPSLQVGAPSGTTVPFTLTALSPGVQYTLTIVITAAGNQIPGEATVVCPD